MIKKIRILFTRFFSVLLDMNELHSQIEKSNSTKKINSVIIGENSILHLESSITNMQGDRNKIFIGNYSNIRGHLQVFKQGGEIHIGDYCYLGENSKIWSAQKIHIGDRVLIAHNVNIHDNNSHPKNSVQRHNDYKRIIGLNNLNAEIFDLSPKSIIIKDNAWIGFNSIILKGVTIGEGAIVGAGSVVTKDVPDFTMVVGNPARIIKTTT